MGRAVYVLLVFAKQSLRNCNVCWVSRPIVAGPCLIGIISPAGDWFFAVFTRRHKLQFPRLDHLVKFFLHLRQTCHYPYGAD